jgi:hypothetical protein
VLNSKCGQLCAAMCVFIWIGRRKTSLPTANFGGLPPMHYRAIVKKRDEYELIFQDLIRQGAIAGVFADVDVKILSYAILTLCTAGATWYKPNGRLTVDEIADIYENFIISGLKQGGLSTPAGC